MEINVKNQDQLLESEIQKKVQDYFVLSDEALSEIYQFTVNLEQKTLDELIHSLHQQRETGLKARLTEAIKTNNKDIIKGLGKIAHHQALIGYQLKVARKTVTAIMRHNYIENAPHKQRNNSTIGQKRGKK